MASAARTGVRSPEIPEFSPAAAAYAMKELARRAGVRSETYRTWRMETDAQGLVNVFVEPGTKKRIRFSQGALEFWKEIRAGIIRTSKAAWMRPPGSLFEVVPDFRIPFSSAKEKEVGLLFSIAS